MKSIEINPGVQILEETNEILIHSGNQQKRIKIEPIMSSILLKIEASGGFVTRKQLIEEIWHGNFPVGNKSLTKNVYKIRKTFEQNGLENPIDTIPKKGYRLVQNAGNHRPGKRAHIHALAMLVVFIVFAIVKIIYPGFLHMMFHRLLH